VEELEFCLDTNVIIEFLKDENSVASKLIIKSKNKARLFVTSITVYELIYGLKYEGFEKELNDVKSFLLWVTILPFDKESAIIAVDIDVALHKAGKPIGLRDVFIAAICYRNRISIVTRNIEHFDLISRETEYKLSVLTPEKAIDELS